MVEPLFALLMINVGLFISSLRAFLMSSDVVLNQVSSDLVSLQNSKVMNKKHVIKRYLKPSYKMRKLKNKGALMVLVWTFLLASVYSNLFALMIPLIEDHNLKVITSV